MCPKGRTLLVECYSRKAFLFLDQRSCLYELIMSSKQTIKSSKTKTGEKMSWLGKWSFQMKTSSSLPSCWSNQSNVRNSTHRQSPSPLAFMCSRQNKSTRARNPASYTRATTPKWVGCSYKSDLQAVWQKRKTFTRRFQLKRWRWREVRTQLKRIKAKVSWRRDLTKTSGWRWSADICLL